MHFDARAEKPRKFIPRPAPPLASIERRHAVYSALLESLPLHAAHNEQLTGKRRLSEETIAREMFASVPARAFAEPIIERLAGAFDLSHVPGFFRSGGKWLLRFIGTHGFYIPIRDYKGRVAALEIRRDTHNSKRRYLLLSTGGEDFPSGASSGAPPHFARHWQVGEALVITEGALKAAVCAELLQQPVCGLVAASTFGDRFGWQLRTWFPRLTRVAIAYDMEDNDKVETQKARLKWALEDARLEVSVFDWPKEVGKGFDDYLIAQGGQWP